MEEAKDNTKQSGKYLYKRGIRYERKIKQELESEGYIVTRSSGSHGIFDIIAFNDKHVRLIQCKALKKESNSNFSKLKNELKQLKVPNCCSKELWIWIDRKGWKKIIIGGKI